MKFLIIDGYPKKSRDDFDAAGMSHAWKLYADMLLRHLPDASYDVLFPSDLEPSEPLDVDLGQYAAVLWTGCNLTIYETWVPTVAKQIALAERCYEEGVPAFGSCWAMQMAAVAAGGEVKANPKGREQGIARKIALTDAGKAHPMYEGKPQVFEGFISHVDEVTGIPAGGVHLASNPFTGIQALAVTHKKGTFWGVQYHPEYTLAEVARLTVAREHKLIPMGFFADHEAMMSYVGELEALAAEPDRKDLRWKLAIDDDVLSDDLRQLEFANFLKHVVLPRERAR